MTRLLDGAELGTPMRGREASSRPRAGRVCGSGGCETVLSTYNESELCWLHSPVTYRPVREARPH